MERRLLLKGVAGAALAAPFLSSLQRDGHAQTVDVPRRLVIFHTSAGCLHQGLSNRTGGPSVGLDTGSDRGNVPLSKLYVTLLNALGATNGGAPITKFGLVDSNDLDAGITDPGELAALRATRP